MPTRLSSRNYLASGVVVRLLHAKSDEDLLVRPIYLLSVFTEFGVPTSCRRFFQLAKPFCCLHRTSHGIESAEGGSVLGKPDQEGAKHGQ